MLEHIEQILQSMQPISLEEMKEVRLMNRTDTKYVVPLEQLVSVLAEAGDEYLVQTSSDGTRMADYHTVYMDTPQRLMFTLHETGRITREKIRMRTYLDTDQTFLEVKDKNNHGRTSKKRIAIPSMDGVADNSEASAFLDKRALYPMADLSPALENRFSRITLVNRGRTERLTIDTGLRFRNLRTDGTADCSHIAIIELKRDGHAFSPMKEQLIRMHIHPMGFSKYCIGSALTDRSLRQNNLKEKLRKLKIKTQNI